MKIEIELFLLRVRRLINEELPRKIAWAMPKTVVMWCCYRAAAKATSGEWGNVSPPSLLFFDMMDRWKK